MQAALSAEVLSRLAEQGWTGIDGGPCRPPLVDVLNFPLSNGLSAQCVIIHELSLAESRDPERVGIACWLGIDHQAARQITNALVGIAVSVALIREPAAVAEVSSESEIVSAGQSAAGSIIDATHRLADSATLETMLALIDEGLAVSGVYPMNVLVDESMDESPEAARRDHYAFESELRPALLTAAERFAEAAESLKLIEPPHDALRPMDERARRRLVRQLWRMIDARGEIAIPRSPACWPPLTGYDANVKLRRRESGVESLEDSFIGSVMKSMVYKLIAPHIDVGHGQNAETTPALLAQLPDRAAYPLRILPRRDWPVALTREGCANVRQLFSERETPSSGGGGSIAVWIESKHCSRGAFGVDGRVAVYAGDQIIGYVGADYVRRIAPAMHAATERDEDVWTIGRVEVPRDGKDVSLLLGLPITAHS